MSSPVETVDVVVCGAGTAGIQAALQLALVGCQVVVLDERGPGKNGARWCNGVLGWQFERANLRPPEPPERRAGRASVHLSSPRGNITFTIDETPIVDVDMRLLTERLRREAESQGVRFVWQTRGATLELDGTRPRAVRTECHGEPHRLDAGLFVDGTGMKAALRRQVPTLDRACPDVAREDTCSARQMVFEVGSATGARQFLVDHGARPGDAIDHVALAGGYSVEVISVERDLSEVSVLVGTLGDGTYGDASSMMADVRARHHWIGKPVFGGGGVIPLRRPFASLATPGLALVGDAACQVMAAHGSGVGFGLMAGKVLAEAVDGADDPGSLATMWRYQSAYHREFGAILAGYDVFRRYSSRVGSDGIQALFAAELFDARLAAPGLDQRLGSIPLRDLPDRLRALATNPSVARYLLPALARMQLVRLLHRTYPKSPDERRLARWNRIADRLVV